MALAHLAHFDAQQHSWSIHRPHAWRHPGHLHRWSRSTNRRSHLWRMAHDRPPAHGRSAWEWPQMADEMTAGSNISLSIQNLISFVCNHIIPCTYNLRMGGFHLIFFQTPTNRLIATYRTHYVQLSINQFMSGSWTCWPWLTPAVRTSDHCLANQSHDYRSSANYNVWWWNTELQPFLSRALSQTKEATLWGGGAKGHMACNLKDQVNNLDTLNH